MRVVLSLMLAEALLVSDYSIRATPGGQACLLDVLSQPEVAVRLDAEQWTLLAMLLATGWAERRSCRGRSRLWWCCICLESLPLGKGLESRRRTTG